MEFKKVLELMKQGHKVKRPHWNGYWKLEGDSIYIHCKDGKVLEIRETKDILFTINNILEDDWEIADSENSKLINGVTVSTFTFGEAIRKLKQGKKVARRGWNGLGMFVVYQKAYPEGIPCNKQTAEAWSMEEGDLFKCEPYLQIKMNNGSHSMWTPSINDTLSEDWYEI